MADHITAHHDRFLAEAAIADAYRRLIALFARYDVPATFAFVLVFTLTAEERRTFAERIVDVAVDGQNWLRHYRAAEAAGNVDGWFCPDALDQVRADPRHEIACHGFCHAPLGEGSIARGDAVRELESARIVAAAKGIAPETFVYPRNQVGHRAELAAAGFRGFRAAAAEPRNALGRKAARLLAEFDTATSAQSPAGQDHGMTVIPSGYFLNWQRGLRRAVPRAVSRRRWRNILDDAADSGRVAHVWLHPHNLIDGPGTLERLEDIVAHAARLRDAGRIILVTQRDYCRSLAGGGGA